MSLMKKIIALIFCVCCFFLLATPFVHADGEERAKYVHGTVISITNEQRGYIPGTDVRSTLQNLKVRMNDGEEKGVVIDLEHNFYKVHEGSRVYLQQIPTETGGYTYMIAEIDRRMFMYALLGLFGVFVVIFSGKQGLRSLLSLLLGLLAVIYILIPALLAGYSPVLVSIAVAIAVLALAIFLTHGFKRISVVAFLGTVSSVVLTGILAYASVFLARLSGVVSEESLYLSINTKGLLDAKGLLLGGILIGILGVLDDVAITQAAVVSELRATATLSAKELYLRAMRVGREHVGALVNTLVLAYVGTGLPLMLYFVTSDRTGVPIISQEIFATEIIRTVVGSMGLILTVPITTALAVSFLRGTKKETISAHTHHHE
jgi:uncharacterized membrane protein